MRGCTIYCDSKLSVFYPAIYAAGGRLARWVYYTAHLKQWPSSNEPCPMRRGPGPPPRAHPPLTRRASGYGGLGAAPWEPLERLLAGAGGQRFFSSSVLRGQSGQMSMESRGRYHSRKRKKR